MKLDAKYDGENRISVPSEVFIHMSKMTLENSSNTELKNQISDFIEFIQTAMNLG